jgi:hypothetical protein
LTHGYEGHGNTPITIKKPVTAVAPAHAGVHTSAANQRQHLHGNDNGIN